MKHRSLKKYFPPSKQRFRGFSLFEALISLFIIGMIFALGSNSLFKHSPKHHLERAAWEIRSRLNQARYRAIFDETKFRVVIGKDFCALEKYDVSQGKWGRIETGFLEGVDLTANNSPIFHPAGTVSNLASIYVSNPMGTYKITLAISGRIKTSKIRSSPKELEGS